MAGTEEVPAGVKATSSATLDVGQTPRAVPDAALQVVPLSEA